MLPGGVVTGAGTTSYLPIFTSTNAVANSGVFVANGVLSWAGQIYVLGTVVATNFNGVGTTASFNGNGSGLTNLNASQLNTGTVPLAQLPLPLLIQTNFIDGQRYTNNYGWPLMIDATIALNTAAVAGSANESLCIQSSPIVGGITNICAISTLTTSAALHYTNQISGFVPTNAIYWFTNLSTGTGNSGAVNGGQIKYP